jgi:hypothetical protein
LLISSSVFVSVAASSFISLVTSATSSSEIGVSISSLLSCAANSFPSIIASAIVLANK